MKIKLMYWRFRAKVERVIWYFLNDVCKVPLCKGYSGICFNKGKRRRQNTAYVDDELNYVFACDKCFEEIQEYWKERWSEYWSMVL